MIKKKEVEKKAELLNVPKSTIDKDWVLGHFLDAIYSIPICRESLIFKGGTCLRKCYFSDYRFSEDLDFTSINNNFIFDKKLLKQIKERQKEGIELAKLRGVYKEMVHGSKEDMKFPELWVFM